MPWRVAFALQADGWFLRSAITWCKRAPMPESVKDRPTNATEMIFLLSKRPRYFYDADAVREPLSDERNAQSGLAKGVWLRGPELGGRNMRNFWVLGPEPYPDAHFATFPTEIPRRAILAGTSERGVCSACGAPWVRVKRQFVSDSQALGWQPTCACNGPTRPAVVLDPFGGSGTTSLVARQLGRHSIYVDLSEQYASLALKRLSGQTLALPMEV